MDLFRAGYIFGRDDCCVAYVIVEDDSVEVNDPVPNGNLKSGRAPICRMNRPHNTIANVIVVRSWVRNVARHAGHGLQEI